MATLKLNKFYCRVCHMPSKLPSHPVCHLLVKRRKKVFSYGALSIQRQPTQAMSKEGENHTRV